MLLSTFLDLPLDLTNNERDDLPPPADLLHALETLL